MIRYTLQCSHGHGFDQWFDNMADYDAKQEAGSLACPECGDTAVGKALMAPSLGAATRTPAAPALPPCATGGCGGGMCPAMAD